MSGMFWGSKNASGPHRVSKRTEDDVFFARVSCLPMGRAAARGFPHGEWGLPQSQKKEQKIEKPPTPRVERSGTAQGLPKSAWCVENLE